MTGNHLVDDIEERRRSQRSKQSSEPASQPDLRKERDCPAAVAWNRRPIAKDEPPALIAGLLGD